MNTHKECKNWLEWELSNVSRSSLPAIVVFQSSDVSQCHVGAVEIYPSKSAVQSTFEHTQHSA